MKEPGRHPAAIPERHYETWGEFKDLLEKYAALKRQTRQRYSFRGHADAGWALQTTLDRAHGSEDASKQESILDDLLHEFITEVQPLPTPSVAGLLKSSAAVECFARHHGLPTSLLDFTRSPYVASYFAFESALTDASSDNVAIWRFDRRNLSLDDAEQFVDDVELLADNLRAQEQRGLFLRIPAGERAERLVGACLTKFTIPRSERELALADLDEMLITARSLYRSSDSAAKTAAIRVNLP